MRYIFKYRALTGESMRFGGYISFEYVNHFGSYFFIVLYFKKYRIYWGIDLKGKFIDKLDKYIRNSKSDKRSLRERG